MSDKISSISDQKERLLERMLMGHLLNYLMNYFFRGISSLESNDDLGLLTRKASLVFNIDTNRKYVAWFVHFPY